MMGIDRRLQGGDPTRISWRLSGKAEDGSPAKGHRHAFYLPVDEDHDGRIDHLYVTSADPFTTGELKVLDRCRSIWQSRGKPDAVLVLSSLSDSPPYVGSRTWASASPFITTRHWRKGRGDLWAWLQDEIKRECAHHGLPEPKEIHPLQGSRGTPSFRWLSFQRSRKGQEDQSGYGFRLVFEDPVEGPFALGAGCHFGLGLFLPER